MKISSIVNNIEFIRPRGELEDYRYGVKPKKASTGATQSVTDESEVVTTSTAAFKAELGKATKAVKPEIELVGKNE